MILVPSRPSGSSRRPTSRLRAGLLALPLLASLTAAAGPAAAQADADKAASDKMFQAGLADMLAGKFADGCPKLQESLRLYPRAGTLFTLAECEAQWGHPAAAIRRYEEYLVMFSKMERAEQDAQRAKGREKKATEQRVALAAQVGRLTVSLPPNAPDGVVVKRDGAVVEPQELGVAVVLDPGEHVVTAQAPGRPEVEQKISLARGEEKQILLDLKLPDPSAAVGPPGPDAGQSSEGLGTIRLAGIITAGVGVAGLATGLVLGKFVFDKSEIVEGHCVDKGNGGAFACDSLGKDAADSGKTLATASTVSVIAGVGLLAAGAVMFFVGPSFEGSPKSAAKRDLYAVKPMITGVGTTGAMIGVSRAW